MPSSYKKIWFSDFTYFFTKTKRRTMISYRMFPVKRKLSILVITGLVFLYPTFYYFYMVKHPSKDQIIFELSNQKDFLINTKGCRIPKFHPFDPSVSIFYYEKTNPLGDCHEEPYLIVDGNKIWLNTKVTNVKFRGKILRCIYQSIIRDPYDSEENADFDVMFGETKSLKFGEALEDEFVKVECFIDKRLAFVDYLALMLLKPEIEEKCNLASNALAEDHLNVIIIAIDSTSKLNFMRHFPLTYGLLQTTIKPFEFHGHNKVADNTFVNIVPMLTGHFVAHYRKGKERVRKTYYDDLDFVWNEFAALGYRTFFIEDTPNAGTFSYMKKGFKYPATDYYLRPFAITVEDTEWRTKNGEYCYGHTSETEFFYEYFRQFAIRMEKRPFFAFTFISRPTHDYLNRAGFVDAPTFLLLQNLVETNVLNNSILIFFSDHGIRFGGIRETYIGKIEERMPFMFQYYPEWFLEKHKDIREALKTNQRRLTTPFDVHKTLQDVLALSSKNGVLGSKEKESFGQSLFREMPSERTCDDAHIMPHWCTCHNHIKLDNYDDKPIIIAEKMIAIINSMTNGTGLCVEQEIEAIIDAFVSTPEESPNSKSVDNLYYLVTIKASPSKAIYEGTFTFENNKLLELGEISRINSYGNQSWCVQDHVLKKYCYCKSML